MLSGYGTSLYGKVEEVPGGLFHVATTFLNFFLLPLVPLRSYVILARRGDSFDGLPIGWCGKSIFAAWLRFVLGATAMVALALVVASLQQSFDWRPYGLAAGALGLFVLTYLHPWFRRATYERARALAQRAGLSELMKIQIDAAYGVITQEEADAAIVALGAERERAFDGDQREAADAMAHRVSMARRELP